MVGYINYSPKIRIKFENEKRNLSFHIHDKKSNKW